MRLRSIVTLLVLALIAAAVSAPVAAQGATIELKLLGTFVAGAFDEGAAEIVAYDPATKALFVVNGETKAIDIVDVSDPAKMLRKASIAVESYGSPTSVDVFGGLVVIAAENGTDPGQVVFADTAGKVLGAVVVGVLPDHIGFTPDGKKVLTANEGQPSDDYSVDPEGSVSIIDVSMGMDKVAEAKAVTVGFADFNVGGPRAGDLSADVRIYGPKATVAQDLEPEYIAVTADSKLAYVTLQENNAVAVIDIEAGKVNAIVALGFKDHSKDGNGFDGSDKDGKISIATYPVLGMYQPDGIAAYQANGMTYLVTANEGDQREYDGYSEEAEVGEMKLDPAKFPNAAELQKEEVIGRLNVTNATGVNADGVAEALYLYGARSFSIWDANGKLVWDSGDQIERKIAELLPAEFNATNDENGSFDNRSDNKGPEPEGVALATLEGRTYAFIGLERIGGIMVYDVTDPLAPTYVTYANNRDFKGDPTAGTAGDLGPEGVLFIAGADSPTGQPLLVVANEISGTVSVWSVLK